MKWYKIQIWSQKFSFLCPFKCPTIHDYCSAPRFGQRLQAVLERAAGAGEH
jgi:hypothetical protein